MIFMIILAALCCCIAAPTLYCTAKFVCVQACLIAAPWLNIEPAYSTRAPPALQHKPNSCLHSCTPAPVSVSRQGTETGVATPYGSLVAQCVMAFAPRTKMHEKSCLRQVLSINTRRQKTMTLAGSATSTTHLCNKAMQRAR